MDIDINLVAHAKNYIDDLARGVNPFTKEIVADDDIINDVKISRCLFYVSEILGEVINNGGVNKKKAPKQKLDKFDLEKLNLNNYTYTIQPITISLIARKINELKPETMEKLKVTAITNWLVDINMLSTVQIHDKNHKHPTANGEAMGITVEQRVGQYGPYNAVLYNESAQRFIIDNLSAIIEGGYNERQRKL